MAEHKVVNVTQLDADLTSIANAIRNRAGTSAKIEFPTGFVNTIRSIPVNTEVGEEIEVDSLSQVHYWTKTGMVGGTINETYKSGDIMLGVSSDTVQYADEVVLEGNNLVLVNPRDYTLATDADAAGEVLVGKYVYTTQSKFYRIPSDVAIIYNAPTQYTPGLMKVSKVYELSVTAGSEEQTTIIVSNDITAYPENGEQGGFTYVYQGSVNESDIPEVAQATPTISVSTNGLITATVTQEAGLVAAGTKSATKQLTTQAAQTITPSTSNKTIASGKYLTGTQTIKGDSNLKAENIKKGVSIFGVAGSHECEGGVSLPELSNLGTASDMALGKELIDQNGNKVTGTLPNGGMLRLLGGSAYEYMDLDGQSGVLLESSADVDRIIRAGDDIGVVATFEQFGNARLEDVVAGKRFTSEKGFMATGTHVCGGGLAVKKGSTSSTTIDTGLSSIDYVVLLADSFSRAGLLQLLYRKPNNAISYILCTSYSYNSQKTELNHASMASSTLLTIDGGKVTWNGTGTSAFMSGASYIWLAFGTE